MRKYKFVHKGLSIGNIYKAKSTPEDVYGYIRIFRGDEVGFSVLPIATLTPDFSNCGVFWVKKKDFFVAFEENAVGNVFER